MMILTLLFNGIPQQGQPESLVKYFITNELPRPGELAQESMLVEKGDSSLAALPELIGDRKISRTTVIVPGEVVTSLQVTLPRGARRHTGKAIPYMVEEDLAAPLESLHIACGQTHTDNSTLVLAIDRELMSQLYILLNEFPWSVTEIVPDYLLLPCDEKPQLCHYDGKILLRLPDGRGLCLATDTLPASTHWPDWDNVDSSNLEQWITGQQFAVNLMQGDFKPATPTSIGSWIRPLSLALAASTCLLLAYFAVTGIYFQKQSASLNAEATELYKALFPQDKRIVNIRRQMEGHLMRNQPGQSDNHFFTLLGSLSDGVTRTGAETITLRHLEFDRLRNNLVVEFQATSMTASQTLLQEIKDSGDNAEILSVSKNDEGIIARMKVGK